jgi:hypothetical protein
MSTAQAKRIERIKAGEIIRMRRELAGLKKKVLTFNRQRIKF